MNGHTIKIILVQSRQQSAFVYRIAKLIGDVFVESLDNKKHHVGDTLDEREARALAQCKRYEVTITEKGGPR